MEEVLDRSKQELLKRGEVASEIIIIRGEELTREPFTFITQKHKRAQQMLLKRRVQKDVTIDAVIFKLDAWVRVIDKDDRGALERAARTGISEDPKRTEAIVINGCTVEKEILWNQPYERKEDKSITFGEISNTDTYVSAFTEGMWTRNIDAVLANYTVPKHNIKLW